MGKNYSSSTAFCLLFSLFFVFLRFSPTKFYEFKTCTSTSGLCSAIRKDFRFFYVIKKFRCFFFSRSCLRSLSRMMFISIFLCAHKNVGVYGFKLARRSLQLQPVFKILNWARRVGKEKEVVIFLHNLSTWKTEIRLFLTKRDVNYEGYIFYDVARTPCSYFLCINPFS